MSKKEHGLDSCIGDEFDKIFSELQNKADFEFFAVSNVSPLRNCYNQEAMQDSRTNFRLDWVERYTGTKMYLNDPVVAFASQTTAATDWRQLEGLVAFEKRHKKFLGQASEEGIRSGVCMSTRQINGDIQLISFANSSGKAYSETDLRAATEAGQLLGKAINELSLEDTDNQPLKMSARELECLSLSAIGKSSSEIEVILGISRHTVDFHMKNVMAKLDASTRTFAIVKAIRFGIINP